MRKPYLILFVTLILGACGQEKSKSEVRESESSSNPDNSFWVPLSESDSVKYIQSTSRVFNQGRDSVMFVHYATDLYKTAEDASNPAFKKQSLELLNLLAQATDLPDTLYLQAMGIKSEGLIKKSTDFNILSARGETEWTIKDGEEWRSLSDFE